MKKKEKYNRFKPTRFRNLNVNVKLMDEEVLQGNIIEFQRNQIVIQTKNKEVISINKSAIKYVAQRNLKKKKNSSEKKEKFIIRCNKN